MRNASWYPIWPAAPVIATRTGVLLFCFMDDVCLDNDTAQPNGGRNITMCMRADRPCRRAMTSASFAVFERLLRETVLAQQAAELVVAQAQNLRRDGLLELRALERTPQHLPLVVGHRGTKIGRHRDVASCR